MQANAARLSVIAELVPHAVEQIVKRKIDHFGARLRPRGCLVLHDSLSAPGVRRAVFERRDRFRVATFATERSNGLTILWPR